MFTEDIINTTNENVETAIENGVTEVTEATKATGFIDSIDPRSFAVGLGTGVVAAVAGKFLYRGGKRFVCKTFDVLFGKKVTNEAAKDQSTSEPTNNGQTDTTTNDSDANAADYKEV